MIDLVIVGAGGFGRETAEIAKVIAESDKNLTVLGFIDDSEEKHGSILNDLPVLGNLDWIKTRDKKTHFVCGIGDPVIKKILVEKAIELGYEPYTLVHPFTNIHSDVKIGNGSVICPGVTITTNIEIRNHVIINQLCSIGHDTIIEDYVTINPLAAVSGEVHLEEGTYISTGATVLDAVRIGEWTILGAGACAITDLPKRSIAVGIPAKVIKERNTNPESEGFTKL